MRAEATGCGTAQQGAAALGHKALSRRVASLARASTQWCGHCKSLAPAWKAAASSLVEHGIKLAKVDATVQTSVAGRFSIQGYPTIKARKGYTQSADQALI